MTEETMETLLTGMQISKTNGEGETKIFTINHVWKDRVNGGDFRKSPSLEKYLETLLPIEGSDMFKDYLFETTDTEGFNYNFTQRSILLCEVYKALVVSKHDKKANNKKTKTPSHH